VEPIWGPCRLSLLLTRRSRPGACCGRRADDDASRRRLVGSGPMIDEKQVLMDESLVEDAVEGGARLLWGGWRLDRAATITWHQADTSYLCVGARAACLPPKRPQSLRALRRSSLARLARARPAGSPRTGDTAMGMARFALRLTGGKMPSHPSGRSQTGTLSLSIGVLAGGYP
jgi:hypothetical protein